MWSIETISLGLNIAIIITTLYYIISLNHRVRQRTSHIFWMISLFVMSTAILYLILLVGVTAVTAIR